MCALCVVCVMRVYVFSCERVCDTVTWAGNVQPRIPHWISLIQPYKRLSCFCSMQKTWKRVVEKRPQPEKHFSSSKKISPRNFRSFARTKEDHRALFPWTKKKTHTIEIEQNDEVSNIAIGYYVVEKYFPSNPSRKKVMLCDVVLLQCFGNFVRQCIVHQEKCGLLNFEKEISVFLSRCVSRLKRNLYQNGVFLFCVFHSVTKRFSSWIKRGFLCRVCLSNVQTGGFSCFFCVGKK